MSVPRLEPALYEPTLEEEYMVEDNALKTPRRLTAVTSESPPTSVTMTHQPSMV